MSQESQQPSEPQQPSKPQQSVELQQSSKPQQQMLDMIQSGFPLVERPYEALGKVLGLSEHDAFITVRTLKERALIRRVGASFNSAKLGYASTLCAFALEPERVDKVAQLVNASPYVTHNYERTHDYNMWFTIVGHGEAHRDAIFEDLKTRAGVQRGLNLPATDLFKIKVDFSAANTPCVADVVASSGPPFSDTCPFDVELVRWAQGDILDCGMRPFDEAAQVISLSIGRDVNASDVLSRLVQFKTHGTIRRFGAMVRHRRMGYACNGMTVWDIPDEHVQAAGACLAKFPQVSHCYARPSMADWAFNMYGMVHARTQEELERSVEAMADALRNAIGLDIPHQVLVSTRELKKTSMTYFGR